jgi:hypothetical protein
MNMLPIVPRRGSPAPVSAVGELRRLSRFSIICGVMK